MSATEHPMRTTTQQPVLDTIETTCAVVGGGPAGVVLALLLARQGIAVTLLEAHADFDRAFRGDTVHPATLELFDEIGVIDKVLRIRHTRINKVTLPFGGNPLTIADFHRLKTRYPYIALLPQVHLLQCLVEEAQRYPNFRVVMGAQVQALVYEGATIRGVRYQSQDGMHEVRALLTVGADGRFSKLRKLIGEEPVTSSPPMDVLWFTLPRRPNEPEGVVAQFNQGHMLIMLDRLDQWQMGYVVLKGSFKQVRAQGIAALQQSIAALEPLIADRVEQVHDWRQFSLLSVESSRVRRWQRPGLLLIGDAAHVMSPVGGVGINYAIQDAVVAANLLAKPLKAGMVREQQLAAVQRRRMLPVRVIQFFQMLVQRFAIANAIKPNKTLDPPRLVRWLLGLPGLRVIPARMVGIGLWRVHA